MDASDIQSDLSDVLYTADQIQNRLNELAAEIEADYAGRDLLLVGVLNGAIMVMADLSRSLKRHCEMDWMAISSYGSGTQSSGVVRILKDLNTDLSGRHVLVVEDIVDTGLTLAYLIPMGMGWPQPQTAAITVMLIAATGQIGRAHV